MTRLSIIVVICAALSLFCYVLGRSHAKTEIITKQIEVVKYVEKKKSAIYSRPHAGRDALLELMRQNKL